MPIRSFSSLTATPQGYDKDWELCRYLLVGLPKRKQELDFFPSAFYLWSESVMGGKRKPYILDVCKMRKLVLLEEFQGLSKDFSNHTSR